MAAQPAHAAVFAVELYRTYVSPTRAPTCRFIPTCSEYAVTALREWGLLRGAALACWRLLKCGPWYPGGWDPVPQRHGHGYSAPGTGDTGGAEDSEVSVPVPTGTETGTTAAGRVRHD
ncbi:membrane protein insertion efficiency factor YidD [Tomitella cavernea]|uniref:membrane protein insertion efficiency factor YidD n=1 Tax=Tomitella cavernea TaxID=1387982 RepID=UPI003557C08A